MHVCVSQRCVSLSCFKLLQPQPLFFLLLYLVLHTPCISQPVTCTGFDSGGGLGDVLVHVSVTGGPVLQGKVTSPSLLCIREH